MSKRHVTGVTNWHVHRQTSLACLFVLQHHIHARLAHRLNHLIKADTVRALAVQRQLRRRDRLDRREGVALDAGNLNQPGDRVTREAEVVFLGWGEQMR
ncbi:hypothetical protein BC938DRAFT_480625 [Jimgerdemannia flammicorona]|uniref:Uncharacterized protein n=1 Tax=Jimgerdemannia flammicorona TaxID=994334 RepID=A0A433QIT6_9FUNG|nr:hypothetical protein BC938DRAFT_480625 [Jimgerdemannia flammicorona]